MDNIGTIFERDDRLKKVFEYCWTISLAVMGVSLDDYKYIDDASKVYPGYMYSQMILNTGYTSLGMNEELRYFFARTR